MIYPWLQEQWQRVWSQVQTEKLPHAMMFAGVKGLGKFEFANTLAAAMLCPEVSLQGEPCGVCHDCRLLAGDVHPNLLKVRPEKPGQAIKIDQVREANEFALQSSLRGKSRFIIFEPADQLNVNAANALLKTLEEPSQGAYLFLVCHQSGLLPATIRSRCQQWHFTTPPSTTALTWLETQSIQVSLPLSVLLNLAHGAPLSALALAKEGVWESRQQFYDALFSLARHQGDALASAAKFQKEELTWLLQLSLSYVMDILKVKSGVLLPSITNTDRENDVKTLVSQTRLSLLADFMAQCSVWQKQLYIGLQLNKTLILEALFYQWMECVK